MARKNYKLFFDLIISGKSIDFDQINASLGHSISPTKIERRGERKSNRIETYYTKDRWVHRFYDGVEMEINAAVEEFASRLEPYYKNLENLSNSFGLEAKVYIAVYKGECWPAVYLPPKSLSFLSKSGLAFELDIID
jgi:hypothetical protein